MSIHQLKPDEWRVVDVMYRVRTVSATGDRHQERPQVWTLRYDARDVETDRVLDDFGYRVKKMVEWCAKEQRPAQTTLLTKKETQENDNQNK